MCERTVSGVGEAMVPQAVVDALIQQITSLQATIERLTAIIEEKNQIILNQNRARFGQSSEKRTYILNDGQLSLFERVGDGITDKAQADAAAEDVKSVTVGAHKRKAKRTLEELCADLPVEEIISDLPEKQKISADGYPLKCIGIDEVRTELVREPSRIFVRKYYCRSYADPRAEARTGYAVIKRAYTPAPLLEHSYASASVVTDVIMKKYADALPLYRQEQIWKREGVDLKRGTMANWVIQTAGKYLRPFSDRFLEELLKQSVIHADETVLQVNREPGRDATDESRIWAYASSKRSEKQIRYFRYEASRKGACAEEVLKGFNGVLVADGYSGYNVVSRVTRAGCWAHARRKWLEAMPKEATKENSLAAKGLEYCSRVFELEREFENLSDAERRRERQERSKPIVDEYYAWIETLFKPSGKLKDAITYAIRQREYLCAFLEHGEIEISNNQVENAIRPIVVGRKNWLFADTPDGARASVIVYTIMETAKANGLNPEKYINHLMTVLPERFAVNPKAAIDDLLPWTEGVRQLCLA